MIRKALRAMVLGALVILFAGCAEGGSGNATARSSELLTSSAPAAPRMVKLQAEETNVVPAAHDTLTPLSADVSVLAPAEVIQRLSTTTAAPYIADPATLTFTLGKYTNAGLPLPDGGTADSTPAYVIAGGAGQCDLGSGPTGNTYAPPASCTALIVADAIAGDLILLSVHGDN